MKRLKELALLSVVVVITVGIMSGGAIAAARLILWGWSGVLLAVLVVMSTGVFTAFVKAALCRVFFSRKEAPRRALRGGE